jgi:PAS domain S-box-containing protein
MLSDLLVVLQGFTILRRCDRVALEPEVALDRQTSPCDDLTPRAGTVGATEERDCSGPGVGQSVGDALRAAEQRLLMATEVADLGIYDHDLTTGVTRWDTRIRQLWGLAPDEPMGLDAFYASVHPDDQAPLHAAIRRAFDPASGGKYATAYRVISRSDGVTRWVSAIGQVSFQDGSPTGVIGTIKDITEARRAEQALRDSQARDAFLLKLSDALRPVTDPIEIQRRASRLFGEHLGVSRVHYADIVDGREAVVRADYVNQVPSLAGRRAVAAYGATVVNALRRNESVVIDDISTDARFSEVERDAFRAAGIAAAMATGLVKHGCWVVAFAVHSATPRVWTGAEVALLQGTAERTWESVERGRAEAALREANLALIEADQRKNEFMAMLSHELRNPLAPIQNSLYVLDRVAPDTEAARRSKAIIDRQVRQLTHLVDDLLDTTRISREKLQLEREIVELNDLVRCAFEDHRSLFEERQIELQVDLCPSPVFVNADTTRISQVVGNLLTNAAKFSAPGGRVHVALGVDTSSRTAVLRVVDSGIGIAPEMLRRMFQPFMQGETTLDRSKGGLGLGLALVKGLLTLHGGEIHAYSEGLGRGAEFVATLPLDVTPATRREEPRMIAAPAPRRVLVVEDNHDAAASLTQLLELGRHESAVVHDGLVGLSRARSFQPHVVLCDIGLPGMDGYAVARAFKEDTHLKACLLVALSGYARPEDVERSVQAGFDRHVAKPLALEVLEQIMSEAPAP